MTTTNGNAGAGRHSILPTLATKIWFGAFLITGTLDILAELFDVDPLKTVMLFVMMPCLFGYVLARTAPRTTLVRWLLAAIVFSWLGDAFGSVTLVKIGFFAAAQLCYLLAFRPFWRKSVLRRPPLLALYAIATAIMIIFFSQHAGALLIAVIGYGLLVGTMAVLATGLGRLGTIGGLLFFVSDTILALLLFVPSANFFGQGALIMLTYLSAQAVLAVGVLAVDRDRQRSGATTHG